MSTKDQVKEALALDGHDLGDGNVLSVKISNPAIKEARHTAA